MRSTLKASVAAALVVLIMFIGSLVLWVGTPLVWLWVGSQVQGATDSLSAAMGSMFVGAVITIGLVATLLAKLSDSYRANCLDRGRDDPGHVMMEGVLVVSAGISITVFSVWFFFFAGADPIPLGLNL